MGHQPQTWQDLTPAFPVSAARMTVIENSLAATASALRGPLSALPAPAAANSGWVFFATDTGQLLRSNGTAWQPYDISDLFQAKGDLLVGAGADIPVRLAPPLLGQVLVGDPSTPSGMRWATPRATVPIPIAPANLNYTPTAGNTPSTLVPDDVNGSYMFADLGSYVEAKVALLTTTPYDANIKVRPQWSSDQGVNWDWLEASGSGLEMAADVATDGSNKPPRTSGWVALRSTAKGEVTLRLVVYSIAGTVAQTATQKSIKYILNVR